MTDARLVEYAASRYGRRNPSFDDVLMERWPRYGEDQIHTQGYHKMSALAFEQVLSRGLKRECVVCGAELDGGNSNRRYCGERCRSNAGHLRARGKGTWNAMSEEEIERMVYLYTVEEMSVTEVGAEVGRSPSAVAKAVAKAGVTMRKSGPREKPKARRAA